MGDTKMQQHCLRVTAARVNPRKVQSDLQQILKEWDLTCGT